MGVVSCVYIATAKEGVVSCFLNEEFSTLQVAILFAKKSCQCGIAIHGY